MVGSTGQRVDSTHIPGGMVQDGMKFHHPTQNTMQFKTLNGLFLKFLFNIFGPWLNTGN